ncbi:hypothetical protein PACTADRAFT_77640 [Pachysolen tannophilus NRRL Y-2460]|uniref:Mitochondrial fission process protein 1 n=1 Tax=Pachysolen tannophilus NRRL Y-2460 TaxID=669874 RepID=A0A1E4TNH9_PACTA|nr:hypothetical protein PACTADRAFT_77640 [Pachysolen tannophilus NRRL Y-2460]
MSGSSVEEETKKVAESVLPSSSDDTTDSSLRYAAYANRFRTILLASHRYIAYSSDIGESFRPVAHPYLVKSGYLISWTYVLGDVAFEGWKAKLRKEGKYIPGLRPWDKVPEASPLAIAAAKDEPDYKFTMIKRGVFQSIASMGLPAFTIHSSVRYSSLLFKNSSNKFLKTWGPVGVGLAIVPLLPTFFDEPVEHAVDYIFDEGAKYFNTKAKVE